MGTVLTTADIHTLTIGAVKMFQDVDGLDHITPQQIASALPAMLATLGVDTIPAGADDPMPHLGIYLVHTCRGGKGPAYGRLNPDECQRCEQRAWEQRHGIAARPAHHGS